MSKKRYSIGLDAGKPEMKKIKVGDLAVENEEEVKEKKVEIPRDKKPSKKGERPPYASYICLPEQEEKLKKIAERMKRSKYEVIQAFLAAGITKYEEAFGKIETVDKEQDFDFL